MDYEFDAGLNRNANPELVDPTELARSETVHRVRGHKPAAGLV